MRDGDEIDLDGLRVMISRVYGIKIIMMKLQRIVISDS